MRILLLDDDASRRGGLRRHLGERFPNVTFGEAATRRQAGDLMRLARWDAVVVGRPLTGGGSDVLAAIREVDPVVPVLLAWPADAEAPRPVEDLVSELRRLGGATPSS